MAPGPGGGLPSIAAMPTHPATNTDVLVLQHTLEDGPGYLGQWLDAHGHTWQVRCTEAGEAWPASIDGFRALAVLGGEWSANDDRPSLRHAEALIREADALGIPVIGHCLGGQLMARALGGQVQRLPQPEVGWWPIEHTGSAAARAWFGEERTPTVYQWHQDSFVTLPPGAELLATPDEVNTSGDFAGLVGTDGFVELPAHQTKFPVGTVVVFTPWV